MTAFKVSTLLGLVALLSEVQAHGYVSGIVANGQYFPGAAPNWKYQNPTPVVAGWYADNIDNGFVSDYGSPDIICHRAATPGKTHIPVAAGSRVQLQWTPWPESHHGPVMDYLAACTNNDCTTIDKNTLRFNKIDQVGLIDGSNPPGRWGSDQMIASNNTWTVTIPASIAPGRYVLRHDTIALHSAGSVGGSQSYPQCVNLEITGRGTNRLAGGTLGTQLYNNNDPGILINIYQRLTSYTVPGGPLISGAGVAEEGGAVDVDAGAPVAPVANAAVPAPQPVAVVDAPPASPASSAPVSFSSTFTGRTGRETKYVCYVEA